jgi:Rod binding domain-containing protein
LARVAPARRDEGIAAPVRRAARQLESAFAAELMKAARPKGPDGMFSGGIGAHTFDSFMDEALGEALARNGELGLASHIARSLARAQAQAGSPSAMPAAAGPEAMVQDRAAQAPPDGSGA